MKASSNRPVSAPVPETAPHVGARFIAPWAADNPPSSPIAASFAARKPRAAARLADPFADPATQKIWAEEHALAFTVAGMARDDILAALRDGLTEVIAGKLSREEWLAGARARLIKAGYWREEGEKGGKPAAEPPQGGRAPLGGAESDRPRKRAGANVGGSVAPSRLQLIFDTNTANAYHGGRWQRLEERRETHPYLMYLTKRDHRVRPEHRAWEGLILPIDHPFWQSHFPPNGFRCRCAVLGVTQAEYDQLKRDGGQFAGGQVKFDNDVDADLEALDPGFAYNPGIPGSRAAALQRLAEEKAARQAAKAAETGAQNKGEAKIAAKTTVSTTAEPHVFVHRNPGLEHLPTTDRTSIEDAALGANADGNAQLKASKDRIRRLKKELRAMPRNTPEQEAAYQAKKSELDSEREKRKRLKYAYRKNCQRCIIAYELRRCGYDVSALARLEDDELPKKWRQLFFDDHPYDKVGSSALWKPKQKAIANLEKKLLSYGEGSRSVVRVVWDAEEKTGHVFIAEVQNGKIVYIDPQTAEIGYTSWKQNFLPSRLRVLRIDDKPINPAHLGRAIKEGR